MQNHTTNLMHEIDRRFGGLALFVALTLSIVTGAILLPMALDLRNIAKEKKGDYYA